MQSRDCVFESRVFEMKPLIDAELRGQVSEQAISGFRNAVFPHQAKELGGCLACHEQHGSSNQKMLKRANVWQLCIECHSPITNTLGSQPPSFHNLNTARYQNCTTCHVAIHGSNRSPQLFK